MSCGEERFLEDEFDVEPWLTKSSCTKELLPLSELDLPKAGVRSLGLSEL
jgi:hypothetical protein